ncbi:MAG TPA: MBL fold metallo-hydrolase [Gaiellales bacterium]|jgi:hydroxyacylglutathione hydrolase|nr:MBL fold metallo-hydrolase [Gaiellales bacterium]
MPRAIPLTGTATWWPSTLYQTTTLELRRAGERLLVDPGISPWEIEEVVSASTMPVTQVLVTHADWDHVMALGALPDAQVTAGRASAERIRSGAARQEIERETAEFLIPHRSIERLHVEQVVDPPAEVRMGPWLGVCRSGPGHTDDGLIVSLPDEHLLVVGDYLSALEIPGVYDSVSAYRDTLEALVGVIERERPQYVVVGHGKPQTSEDALRIADEDLAYLEAVLAHAKAGCPPEDVDRIAVPQRGAGSADRTMHAANVAKACEAAAAVGAQG